MSLKDIHLKPQYISLRDDVAKEFYVPLMRECVRFDRVSCYFSLGALSKYCEGLYYLGKENQGKYRLIISNDIDEETFEIIKEGYDRQRFLDDFVKERMRDELTLGDRLNLSNLSYLMACGVVEVKFGFCSEGLFHSKSGYVADSYGNSLCFTGSNNETRRSFELNYEKFDVTTSWLSSEFDRRRIEDTRKEFDDFWTNTSEYAMVFDPPDTFNEYMSRMNRGRLFCDTSELISESLFLDIMDDTPVLNVPQGIVSTSSIKFGAKIMSAVESTTDSEIIFKNGLNRRQLRSVYDRIMDFCRKKGLTLEISDSFGHRLFKESRMDSLSLLGRAIKERNPILDDEFRLFRTIVDDNTERKLREEQMYDSFFLCKMSRAANFSVPGSGKTSTVLGMFAFLHATSSVERMVVIGPLSSFDSWITEFHAVFGGIIPLKSFRSDEHLGNLRFDYQFNSGGCNLLLFNYECFDHDIQLVKLLSSRMDSSTLLIFDEVHRVKKIGGERATKMLSVSQNASNIVVMTGTPIPNSYSDAYNFLHLMFGDDDYDEYFSMSPDSLSHMSSKQMEVFNRLLYPFFCRTTKQRLGVPPANTDNIIRILATHQEEALLTRLRDTEMNPLVKIVRMLQLESDPSMLALSISKDELDFFDCSGLGTNIGMDIGTDSYGPPSKLLACLDLITRLVNEGKQVIVWCIFLQSMHNIQEGLFSRGISACQINGSTENRASIIDEFRKGIFQVMVTNPQTLSESISLHDVCHDAVYFEYSYNLVHLLQSKDRIHRLGLPDGQYTQYHFIEVEFIDEGKTISLDREIHNRLSAKEEIMMDAIENDVFEHYDSPSTEVKEILIDIGMIRGDGDAAHKSD